MARVRLGALVVWLLLVAVSVNGVMLYLLLTTASQPSTGSSKAGEEAALVPGPKQSTEDHSITLLVRDFEEWAHAVPSTLMDAADAVSGIAAIKQVRAALK